MRSYRLLQSWYREVVRNARPGTYRPRGQPERPLGSLLHREDVAARPGLNFLSPEIGDYARSRAASVVESGGTLDVDRLDHNMLSSMPMCFNLFGMLRTMPVGQLPLVRACFDATAEAVEMIECEWVPEHPASTLSDRTAFDAAIVTRRSDGSRHLIAIETKYTEPFSQTRYGARSHDAGKYRGMHEASGWFQHESHDELTGSATNQLWRNSLLAASAERSGEVDSASVVVVALSDDRHAQSAVAGVTAAMVDPGRSRSVPLEVVVREAKAVDALRSSAIEFERRYLDLSMVR